MRLRQTELSGDDTTFSVQAWSDQTELSLLHEPRFYKLCRQSSYHGSKARVETSTTGNSVPGPVYFWKSQTFIE